MPLPAALTAAQLAKALASARSARDKAGAAIFAAAAHEHERFEDIKARLGRESPLVSAFSAAQDQVNSLVCECELRFGPAVSHPAFWGTFLRNLRGRSRRPRAR